MKKLIGLFAILMITTGVFGQKFIRSHSFIETTPKGLTTIEDAIHRTNFPNGNYDWVRYVHFIQNGKLYLLSYEPNDRFLQGVDRDVYLYSKDTSDIDKPWEVASEVVITSNWFDMKNYGEIDFSRSDMSRGSVGEVQIDGDKVYITVGLEIMTNGRLQINEPVTFGFTWDKSNGRYHKFIKYQQVSYDNSRTL